MTNSEYEKAYLVSQPLVQINNADAPDELIKDIMQISIEESLHLPSMFMMVVHNAYRPSRPEDQPWQQPYIEQLKIGNKISIGFVSSTTTAFPEPKQDYLIIGAEITAIDVNFTNGAEAHIVVRGYDIAHRLHRGRYNRSFLSQTDSDIVRKIASEVGIQLGQVDDSGEPHDYVFQENQTNMEFLRERAARIGFELFVQDSQLNFRKPQTPQNNDSLTNLQWLKDISSFSTRVTSAEQVSTVEVRSWDYSQKRLISPTASSEQVITSNNYGKGSSTSNKFQVTPKMTVVDRPVFKLKHAEAMAQALCNELGGEFVYADARAEGNPTIRPGRVISLNDDGSGGMGPYNGQYYVTETRHFYQERVYTTFFSVRGLRGSNLLTTLSPQANLKPGQTLLVGIVTNNQDPMGWGRVKVKFPTLTEEHESNWARLVGLGAGPSRGFYNLPEVNDEVLVAFEHGDIHRPYVIGGVWNGQDPTPASIDNTVQGGQVRLRKIKTRTGHTIEFVEEDRGNSKKGIYIETAGQHKLYLNDSDSTIQIQTSGGHEIKMSNNDLTISVISKGHLSLSAIGNITLKAGGKIVANCPIETIPDFQSDTLPGLQ
jgi:phage protein D